MFESLPVSDKGIFAFKASGKLSDADYQTFLPMLEGLIRKSGGLSLYIELEDFQGWEPRAAWDDLRFGRQHDRDFRRIAIVGDKAWEHSAIALANFFTHTDMRFFSNTESAAAWDWLREKPAPEKAVTPLQPYRHILLATDFSECSEQAALRALELSRRYDAHLEVLHVIEEMTFYAEEYDPIIADIPLLDETRKEQAEAQMKRFTRQTGLPDDIRLEVQWGQPKWAIVSWSREQDIDLIVMGSHGRHGLERLLGSVSTGVLHQAHCEVLVVKS